MLKQSLIIFENYPSLALCAFVFWRAFLRLSLHPILIYSTPPHSSPPKDDVHFFKN